MKKLFTDNGTEYINNLFKIYLQKYGIIHYIIPVYTIKLNGLIKNKPYLIK